MKRDLARQTIRSWTEKIGRKKAIGMISGTLECSASKAEKLADGRYPSVPTPLEQKALAKLTRIKRDDLFPVVTATEERAS